MQTMTTIDGACVDGDGLKWFNGLYLQVTQAVALRIAAGGFNDPTWLAELVQFARLYFAALSAHLQGMECSACWRVMFDVRNNTRLARIQLALAGVNAHINHDLPEALVATCQATGTARQSRNASMRRLLESQRHARLPRRRGQADAARSVARGSTTGRLHRLEDTIAAFGVKAAREKSWATSQVLWHIKDSPDLEAGMMDSVDGLTTVVNKALLAPVP